MTLRKLLHTLRLADFWLLWPALALVIWGELTPHPPAFTAHVWDKLLHFTAYFGLSLTATLALRANRRTVYAVIALIVLGGVLEIIQGLVGRDADIHDEIANTLGALVGVGVGWLAVFILKARKLVEDKPAD